MTRTISSVPMTRTRDIVPKVPMLTNREVQVLTTVIRARAELAARLGKQYGGDRDIYEALGYKALDQIDYE